MKNRLFLYDMLVIIPFLIDRVSKYAILKASNYLPLSFSPVLTFDITFNRGISWGIFHTTSTTQFLIVSSLIAIVAGLLVMYALTQYRNGQAIHGELLVMTGAVSNLVDRIIYGGVLDFIIISYKGFAWPTFNVADACIVAGILIMAYRMYTK